MSKQRIRFADLRQFLLSLGFREAVLSEAHVGFQHDASDTLIVLPVYRVNELVAPHHLATARIMLDGKGLVDAVEFDRLLASVAVRPSAS